MAKPAPKVAQQATKKVYETGLRTVRQAKAVRPAGQQTHHLIEQRAIKYSKELRTALRNSGKSHLDMPGLNLKSGAGSHHQMFIERWKAFLPKKPIGGPAPSYRIADVMAAAEQVYQGYPLLQSAAMKWLASMLGAL